MSHFYKTVNNYYNILNPLLLGKLTIKLIKISCHLYIEIGNS